MDLTAFAKSLGYEPLSHGNGFVSTEGHAVTRAVMAYAQSNPEYAKQIDRSEREGAAKPA